MYIMKRLVICSFIFFVPFMLYAQYSQQVKQLDSIFNILYEQNQFNGSMIIAEKGKIILKKGYGYSNESTKKSK